MNKPKATGRMMQWAIKRSQFNNECHPRKVIKAQALADFVVKFTIPDEEEAQDE